MKHFCRLILCFVIVCSVFAILGSQKFIEAIDKIVDNSGCHTGVAIYSIKQNRIVYEKNATQLFTPASNMKLFVVVAAMNILGFDYQFPTILATDGEIKEGGLYGNLFLKGAGDPSLTIKDIEQLLKGLTEQHIQRVQGNFYIAACLFTLSQWCLKESDNLYANCIFKRIGVVYGQQVGSWQQGVAATKTFLDEKVYLDPAQLKIVEGSGLSRYNLISPLQIMQLLLWASKNEQFESFLDLFPVAGIDGTLATRMLDCAGKIKAKTGTLGGVSTLSGYALKDDDVLIFSIMNNGYVADSVCEPLCKAQVEDAICRIMLNEIIT